MMGGRRIPTHPDSPCRACEKELICEGTNSAGNHPKGACKEWLDWFGKEWREIQKNYEAKTTK